MLVLVCKIMLDDAQSKDLNNRLRNYLQAVLHIRVDLEPWKSKDKLPMFLAKAFDFYEADLLSTHCLFVIVTKDSKLTPSELERRHANLRKDIDDVIVFVFEAMSSHVRARLIEKALPFVVPDNQLYIPALGMDLREYFRSKMPTSSERLSPAAQVVLFRHLLIPNQDTWTPSNLAKKLRYSAMTVGRAFDELSANKLASVEPLGRSKLLVFSSPPDEIFEKARPLLRSPVKSIHFFRPRDMPEGFYGTTLTQTFAAGGESALAERSMLNPPRHPHFAVGPKDWKSLQAGEFGEEVDDQDEAGFGVDVWRYDPDIVTGNKQADPLSLFMQFQAHEDERVAEAAAQLMENVRWYRG